MNAKQREINYFVNLNKFKIMKYILFLFFFFISLYQSKAQNIDCNAICVFQIDVDSITGDMEVIIYNGDTVNINYPIVQVIDANGDTIGNPGGTFTLFAHPAGDTVTHVISSTVTSLPAGFSGTVFITDGISNSSCLISFPMNCFTGQPYPDCDDLIVESISNDTTTGTMDITIYNSCLSCASGINGPVYCELKLIRSVAPYDTLGEANCFCFFTPENNNYQTYTISSYVNNLPAFNLITVLFSCGSGLCDTLQFNPNIGISEEIEAGIITINPNPVKDKIFISTTYHEIGALRIYDIMGKLIHEEMVSNKIADLDLSEMLPGMYVLKIGARYRKFIKQ
jgi:hypothetical protein